MRRILIFLPVILLLFHSVPICPVPIRPVPIRLIHSRAAVRLFPGLIQFFHFKTQFHKIFCRFVQKFILVINDIKFSFQLHSTYIKLHDFPGLKVFFRRLIGDRRDSKVFFNRLHLILASFTGVYLVTFSIVGPILGPMFDKYDLHRKNLSRMLEDTGTAFSPIVPWSNISIFILGTLGVSSFQYVLYAPITYLGVVFAAVYIFMGFGIFNSKGEMLIKEKK